MNGRNTPFTREVSPEQSGMVSRATNRSGYTLIELLAVMTIIAIIMMIAMAGFSGTSRAAAPRKAAENVETALSLARQYAVSRNSPMLFLILDGGFNARHPGTYPLGDGSDAKIASFGPARGRNYAIFDPARRVYVTGWTELPMGVVFDADYSVSSGGRNVLSFDEDMFYKRPIAVTSPMIPFPGTSDTNRLVILPGVAFKADGTVFVRSGDTTESRRVNVAEGSVAADGTVTVRTGGLKYGIKVSMLGNAVAEEN